MCSCSLGPCALNVEASHLRSIFFFPTSQIFDTLTHSGSVKLAFFFLPSFSITMLTPGDVQRCQTVIHDINVDWVFHFPTSLAFCPISRSLPLSLCLSPPPLSQSFSPSISVSLIQPRPDSPARPSLQRYFTLMVLFFSLLSVFLSFPHLSSRYCTDGVRCWLGW